MVELQRERRDFPDIKGQRFKRCYWLDRVWLMFVDDLAMDELIFPACDEGHHTNGIPGYRRNATLCQYGGQPDPYGALAVYCCVICSLSAGCSLFAGQQRDDCGRSGFPGVAGSQTFHPSAKIPR